MSKNIAKIHILEKAYLYAVDSADGAADYNGKRVCVYGGGGRDKERKQNLAGIIIFFNSRKSIIFTLLMWQNVDKSDVSMVKIFNENKATHGTISKMEEFRRNTCFRELHQICRTQQSLNSRGTGFN